ncbi:Zn(2)-C6 fungal-type DNA-binding domain [Phaffia rhodozyma]|uniref:Zn(2)-C6 fungal-type DNA-binding domain n=1 Tax=Phaffia rhodozyma TaxID=264483 RepID=A0A0F7SPF9_PHARH|nr:Zn(2)-C6 fungal-type DNA-binding domain [Phaffia rhodozyma]
MSPFASAESSPSPSGSASASLSFAISSGLPDLFSTNTAVSSTSRVNQACTLCRSRKVKCSGSIDNGACSRCKAAGKTDCAFEAVPFEDKVATRERKARRKANSVKIASVASSSLPIPSSPASNGLTIRRRRDRPKVSIPLSPRPYTQKVVPAFLTPIHHSSTMPNQRSRRNALCSGHISLERSHSEYEPNTGLVYPILESPYYSPIDRDSDQNVYPSPTSEPRSMLEPGTDESMSTALSFYDVISLNQATQPLPGHLSYSPAYSFDSRAIGPATSSSSVDLPIMLSSLEGTITDDYFSIPIDHSVEVDYLSGLGLGLANGSSSSSSHLTGHTIDDPLALDPCLTLNLNDSFIELGINFPVAHIRLSDHPLTPPSERTMELELDESRVGKWVKAGLCVEQVDIMERPIEWMLA